MSNLSVKHKRYFIGLDGQGRVVPNNLIAADVKPKDGIWVEVAGLHEVKVTLAIGEDGTDITVKRDGDNIAVISVAETTAAAIVDELNTSNSGLGTFSTSGGKLILKTTLAGITLASAEI